MLVLDIDPEHLLRLKNKKDKEVETYLATRREAREVRSAPQAKLPSVVKDYFTKTLRDLHRVRGDRLEFTNYLLPMEEEGTPAKSWRPEKDPICSYRTSCGGRKGSPKTIRIPHGYTPFFG